MRDQGLVRIVRFFLDRRASPMVKLLFVLAILYVISPIDFVPDLAVVVGWIDDLVVALGATTSLVMAIRRYQTSAASSAAPKAREVAPRVVDAEGVEVR